MAIKDTYREICDDCRRQPISWGNCSCPDRKKVKTCPKCYGDINAVVNVLGKSDGCRCDK